MRRCRPYATRSAANPGSVAMPSAATRARRSSVVASTWSPSGSVRVNRSTRAAWSARWASWTRSMPSATAASTVPSAVAAASAAVPVGSRPAPCAVVAVASTIRTVPRAVTRTWSPEAPAAPTASAAPAPAPDAIGRPWPSTTRSTAAPSSAGPSHRTGSGTSLSWGGQTSLGSRTSNAASPSPAAATPAAAPAAATPAAAPASPATAGPDDPSSGACNSVSSDTSTTPTPDDGNTSSCTSTRSGHDAQVAVRTGWPSSTKDVPAVAVARSSVRSWSCTRPSPSGVIVTSRSTNGTYACVCRCCTCRRASAASSKRSSAIAARDSASAARTVCGSSGSTCSVATVPDQADPSLMPSRSTSAPPWHIAPSRPLPTGSASVQVVAGPRYRSTAVMPAPAGRGRRRSARPGRRRRRARCPRCPG